MENKMKIRLLNILSLLAIGALVIAAIAMTLSSCSLYYLESHLDPAIRTWYEQHYIIMEYPIPKDLGNGTERTYFLRLPRELQGLYISKFWDIREIGTKEEYDLRIRVATKFFRGEGIDPWQTDLGRIMLLIGQPFDEQFRDERGTLYQEGEEQWGYARQEGRRWFRLWLYWWGEGFFQQIMTLYFEWDGIDRWCFMEPTDTLRREFMMYWRWRMAPTPEGWDLWRLMI
jgi:GWxTD domain-containing protein